VQKKLSV